MPRYIIERNVPPSMSREELSAAARRSKEVIGSMPGLVWIRSFISEADGKIYCEYDAPSLDAVMKHARLAGLPADRVTEVTWEISPDMFV